MKMANFILPLALSLLSAPILAQEANVAGNGKPNGLSDQDYLIQREKILKRMTGANPQSGRQPPEQPGNVNEAPAHDSTYGQGYRSRKTDKDADQGKPAVEVSRPQRPEIPHFERPGR